MQVKLPLEVGTIVDTLWRDDKYYTARVIERRQDQSSDAFQYYVHFLRCKHYQLRAKEPLSLYEISCWISIP